MNKKLLKVGTFGTWLPSTVKHGCLQSILFLQRAYESPERHFEFLGTRGKYINAIFRGFLEIFDLKFTDLSNCDNFVLGRKNKIYQ